MGFHDSFEYLKHKLWPKEEAKIKMSIWLPPTKSQKLPWNKCMHMACHIFLEISQRRLQLLLEPHINQGSAQDVVAFQSVDNPNFGSFKSPKTKWHLNVTLMTNHREYYKGEGGGFPKSDLWWVLWIRVCSWFIHAPKMF
jgi:hypothetical protein